MKISAFDLDRTLLNVNCSFHFGRYLYNINEINLSTLFSLLSCYAAHTLGIVSLKNLHSQSFSRLFRGRSHAYFVSHVNRFLDLHLTSLLHSSTMQKLQESKDEGHRIYILSSSPDFLVDLIAKRLDVSMGGATKYVVGADDHFNALGQLMDGAQKAQQLLQLANRLQVSRENIYAYSDSHLDLPFLEAAGNPVVVKPTRKLKNIALKRGWKVLS